MGWTDNGELIDYGAGMYIEGRAERLIQER